MGEYDGSDLAVLIPLWERTRHIARVHASVRAATPAAFVLFIVSTGDQPARDAACQYAYTGNSSRTAVLLVDGPGGKRGDYAKKINAGYRATVEPFVFTGADDLDFHDGWYDAARAAQAQLPWPQDSDGFGVVGTNDLCNPRTMEGHHSTHSLIARWYADCCAVVDQPGAIYHEGYGHQYCDDELVQTARRRGAYAHALDAIVEHLHPWAGKGLEDATYARGRVGTGQSRSLFLRRRRLWAKL